MIRILLLLLLLKVIVTDSYAQRCFKGTAKTGDECYFILNNDSTFEMTVLSKFHSEISSFKIEGRFTETKSGLVLDNYFNYKNMEINKVGRSIEITLLHEKVRLRRFKCKKLTHLELKK